MERLRFEALGRAYGSKQVFEDVSGVMRDGRTVGLVGPNGAGKSSLVRTLVGMDPVEDGRIVRARESRLGYLSQTANVDAKTTLRGLLDEAFARERRAENRLRELEHHIGDVEHDMDLLEKALAAYGEAREAFDLHGGVGFESRMRGMLASFDFDEADLDRPTSGFSGGQRTRASLARLLLEEPDYLILDEPTNHLDIETVRWLEDFLIEDPRASLVVSHDRFFLDRVANEIWELDGGSLDTYEVKRGRGYADYLEQKAERLERAQRDYEKFVEEDKRRKAVIAELRTHGSHNYSHVRSREKAFAKIERVEAPQTSQAQINVKLQAARRATNGLALRARGVSLAYAAPLFTKLDLDVQRGERIAIVGPNGAGKSTLLRVLAGDIAADGGDVAIQTGIKYAYFAQDSADDLPATMTAAEAVADGTGAHDQEARGLLGRLGLGGDAVDKPVSAFSGGERRRIMLARLMARSADLLFLDEPTNDLDIPSREALESVLAGYGGAMLVVSHDRYLLRRLADRVLWLRDGKATFVDGGYERFEELLRAKALPGMGGAEPPAKKNGTAVKENGKSGNGKPSGGKGARQEPTGDARDAAGNGRSGGTGKSSGNGNGRGPESTSGEAVPPSNDASGDGSKGNGSATGTASKFEKPARKTPAEKTLAAAEREVARLDEERARLEREFADPDVYGNRARVAELKAALAKSTADVEAAFARWEALSLEPSV